MKDEATTPLRRANFILHPSAFILKVGGCSSVGRASAFQAEGREFESRRPLHVTQIVNLRLRLERMSKLTTCSTSARVAQG